MSNLLLALYKKMYLIREAEAEIRREYPKDEMKTPMHMSLGQEAIVAGVCQALPEGSHAYGTYRSHALYLAWTGETDKFFAELYGKANGTAGGKAGSMHLASPEHGLMATSAVVGTTIPLALGDAFEAQYNGLDRITATFFGDGTTDEGVFWESLNVACLFRLPILFICEDNDLAIHISKRQRRGFYSLTDIVRNFKCAVFEDKGNDAEKVYSLACRAINLIRIECRPSLLNLTYHRGLEHVGVNKDFDAGYRSEQESIEWFKKDPLDTLKEKLSKDYPEELVRIEEQIRDQVLESRVKAQKANFSTTAELTKGVFYGE